MGWIEHILLIRISGFMEILFRKHQMFISQVEMDIIREILMIKIDGKVILEVGGSKKP